MSDAAEVVEVDDGYVYELRLNAEIRALGADCAHRVARDLSLAAARIIREHRDVVSLERTPATSSAPVGCTSDARCRASLHYAECPRRS